MSKKTYTIRYTRDETSITKRQTKHRYLNGAPVIVTDATEAVSVASPIWNLRGPFHYPFKMKP